MKFYAVITFILLVFVIPCILFSQLENNLTSDNSSIESSVTLIQEPEFTVCVQQSDEYINMPIDEYVASVLLGEMPASFEMEALMAQAVAIRTYTLRRMLGSNKHATNALCTDPGCCQAFAMLSSGADSQRMVDAAQRTAGEVLLYEGEFVEATYFSCSGGYTEAALEVWGMDVPYLQAQPSPGEESARVYETTVTIPMETFAQQLGITPVSTIDEILRTSGGGVKTIWIGGREFSGLQLRKILGLRSTSFNIQIQDDQVVITTKGFGHRVGMSQYGAEAMAISGSTYKEILAYYYPGTDHVKMSTVELHAVFDKAGIL